MCRAVRFQPGTAPEPPEAERPDHLDRLRWRDRSDRCPIGKGINRATVKVAEVKDGTSNTAAFSEHAHGLLAKDDYVPGSFYDWGWWNSGNLGDSIYTAFYPVNPFRKTQNITRFDQAGPYINAASSFHPGGLNVAMCDGSVRFIKDTIDTWALDPSTGLPPGVTVQRRCLDHRAGNQDRGLAGDPHDRRRRDGQPGSVQLIRTLAGLCRPLMDKSPPLVLRHEGGIL
ncbi:MAG: hypothetical protein KatS3mg108_1328 [Isosphaeraceae bacterium]|nr:MAG: hypothetical protein KatS3mg108_1328 [Isosphaeraceae bacterium]